MRSSKSSVLGLMAMASLALAASGTNAIRRNEHDYVTPSPKKRPVRSIYSEEHRAWNEAIDAKRAAKKATP